MSVSAPQAGLARPASLWELFLAFSGLALRGFGGVLPWAHRVLVEERRWVSREEFVELIAFGQVFPGPNVCNVALMVGDRFFGWRGAAVALAGMLAAPAAIVLAAVAAYDQVAHLEPVRRAVAGMAAVAAGLIIATAFKLALALRGGKAWLLFGLAAFAGVGLMRWPLLWVLAVLGPAAVGLAWFSERR